MAEIAQRPKVEVTAYFTFNEAELRALDALVGYGTDSFLKVFYEKLGQNYMKPHEAGLRSLFECIRKSVPPILRRTDDARAVFTGEKIAQRPKAEMVSEPVAPPTPAAGSATEGGKR